LGGGGEGLTGCIKERRGDHALTEKKRREKKKGNDQGNKSQRERRRGRGGREKKKEEVFVCDFDPEKVIRCDKAFRRKERKGKKGRKNLGA